MASIFRKTIEIFSCLWVGPKFVINPLPPYALQTAQMVQESAARRNKYGFTPLLLLAKAIADVSDDVFGTP